MVTNVQQPITTGDTSDEARLFMTPDELWNVFDGWTRYHLGLSGAEFVERWDAGEFSDRFDAPGEWALTDLAMMVPVVRSLVR